MELLILLGFLTGWFVCWMQESSSRRKSKQMEMDLEQVALHLQSHLELEKPLMLELRSRLAEDLEKWSRYLSLAYSGSAKEMAQEKVKQLRSQLESVTAMVQE